MEGSSSRGRRGRSPGRRAASGFLVCVFFACAGGAPARPSVADSTPGFTVDTTGLASGGHGRMHTLLEKTIFQVNVLDVTVRLGRDDAVRIARLSDERGLSGAARDSAAEVAARSTNALARVRFRRDVSLSRFLEAVVHNLRAARAAGYLTEAEAEEIAAALPGWYAFLRERGVREGDRMLYRVRGDTLHTLFVSRSGEVLLDTRDVGAHRRLAVLGGYFAPGSDFREGLLDSLPAGSGSGVRGGGDARRDSGGPGVGSGPRRRPP